VALVGYRRQQAAEFVLVGKAVARMFAVALDVGEWIWLAAQAEPGGEIEQRMAETLHPVCQGLVARPRDLVEDRQRILVLDVVDPLRPIAGAT
jgi:hypothetical protein